MSATVLRIEDARLCRQRRAALDLEARARAAAECVAYRAIDRGLSVDVADACAEAARTAVLTGRATPGGAIGNAWQRIRRLRRAPQPGDAA